VLSGEAHATYFLLEQGGAVKAQLMITYEWSDWRAGVVWWIQSVYVQPQHRQQVGWQADRHCATGCATEHPLPVGMMPQLGHVSSEELD
jgi:hypothetical protein